ncbi:hypothetical protein FEI14_08430 [Lacticaseibacillus zeae]|uniref:Uncharacterized protein n=1 Tax=Lacticaseibacillus zeae TaxID=57037 RepID=A0A5R8LVY2_LACZE|nr:hypothetical protein FEI14_08430 [Lacticaseibacillus zeae]
MLDQRLTRINRGQQDALLAGFHPEGVPDPAALPDLASPQHHRAYLVMAADSATAKPFLQALSPAAATLISLSGGGDHA